MGWLKRWGSWLLAGLLALFGAGAMLAAQRRKRALEALARDLEVTRARKQVDELRAERRVLAEQEPRFEQQIREVDAKLEANKRELEQAHAKYGLSAQEIADELQKLGY